MLKKCSFALTAAGLFLAAAAIFFWPKPAPIHGPTPISMRYVKGVDIITIDSSQPTFWVTNHTDKTLFIMLLTIEVQTNRGWTTNYQAPLPDPLCFSKSEKQGIRAETWLDPHEAAYGQMQAHRLVPPTNGVWRARALVTEKLVGYADTISAIRMEPALLRRRLLKGDTNVPINPFGKNISRSAHPSQVLSEEVMSH